MEMKGWRKFMYILNRELDNPTIYSNRYHAWNDLAKDYYNHTLKPGFAQAVSMLFQVYDCEDVTQRATILNAIIKSINQWETDLTTLVEDHYIDQVGSICAADVVED